MPTSLPKPRKNVGVSGLYSSVSACGFDVTHRAISLGPPGDDPSRKRERGIGAPLLRFLAFTSSAAFRSASLHRFSFTIGASPNVVPASRKKSAAQRPLLCGRSQSQTPLRVFSADPLPPPGRVALTSANTAREQEHGNSNYPRENETHCRTQRRAGNLPPQAGNRRRHCPARANSPSSPPP